MFGIVTNKDQPGNDLINWLYERCGQSEEVHRAMKDDFAGGALPCGGFGINDAIDTQALVWHTQSSKEQVLIFI